MTMFVVGLRCWVWSLFVVCCLSFVVDAYWFLIVGFECLLRGWWCLRFVVDCCYLLLDVGRCLLAV